MDSFKSLGKRDIFGILLPGMIPILISAYSIWGMLVLLHLTAKNLLKYEILLAVVFFITAYLVGSLLRLFAADDIDRESSKYLLKDWSKNYLKKAGSNYLEKFETFKTELAKGEKVADDPAGFDQWLWRADVFPYTAWQNRFWYTNGFDEVRDFYREKYHDSMWPKKKISPKSFFNYCKLVLIGSNGTLADEANAAEGLTRFFAGTVAAFRLSIWMLGLTLSIQAVIIATVKLGPRWGMVWAIPVDWQFQISYEALTLVLIFILQQMCRLIVKKFRHLRQKEAETVFHAFYLCSKQLGGNRKDGEQ